VRREPICRRDHICETNANFDPAQSGHKPRKLLMCLNEISNFRKYWITTYCRDAGSASLFRRERRARVQPLTGFLRLFDYDDSAWLRDKSFDPII
jgi:hypothetical protein